MQRVFIIDDNIELCNALRWLFESVKLTVETYSNALDFLASNSANTRGCLITDVRLPGMSGVELLEKLKQEHSSLAVVVMTAYADIPMAIRVMKAGAADFILKPYNDQCLLELVQRCLQYKNEPDINFNERIKLLTEREHQVTQLIMNGKLNKEIAYELSISQSTVEAHRANIMKKMKAKNLAQLIKMFLQEELRRDFV